MAPVKLSDPNGLPRMTLKAPSPEILHLLEVAFSKHYGNLSSEANPAHMYAFHELRDVALPAWKADNVVDLNLNHQTTLVAAIAAYETKLLDTFRGDRTTQRKKCHKAHPDVLRTITNARSWAK